jgi:hypothetical protein
MGALIVIGVVVILVWLAAIVLKMFPGDKELLKKYHDDIKRRNRRP